MVIGYYDGSGYPNLVNGDASVMSDSVRVMIANDNADSNCAAAIPDHYHDYSCPLDTPPALLPDKSETGGAHTSDCVGDFMFTSWSSLGNYYGWSWSSSVPGAFVGYTGYADPAYSTGATRQDFWQFTWEEYKEEIDSGYPVVLLVDIDGDGNTDHFVTGIGYDESTTEYGVYNTWDTDIHWYQWRETSVGAPWGIFDVCTFRMFELCGDVNSDGELNVYDVTPLIAYLFMGGPAPDPLASADVDLCESINVSDVVHLCDYMFCGGPDPCTPIDPCYLPTGANEILLDCPVNLAVADGDSVAIPIRLTNYSPLEGFSLGFSYNSDDVEITSFDTTGSIIPDQWKSYVFGNFLPDQNRVLVGGVDIPCTYPIDPQVGGLLITLWMQVSPGTPDQWIDIDTTFVPPGGEFILSVDGGGSIRPIYSDCGTEDVRIGYLPICGDVNGDGDVNVLDVSYLLTYIIADWTPPVAMVAADVDECGTVNMADVSYLCEHLYVGGPAPCMGSVDCDLSTGGNEVALGCPIVTGEPTGDSVALPIYFTNDVPVSGFTLGFSHNSDDIEFTSVDLTGSVIPTEMQTYFYGRFTPAENQILIGAVDVLGTNSIGSQTGGLLATLWVQVPSSTPDQIVDLDSIWVTPAGEFIFCVLNGGSITPQYTDCGTADILINPQYICGDADGSGEIDIDDVVYLIAYIFSGGPSPEPLLAGDADCSGDVDIDDVVYLIAYIFSGGPPPGDPNGDGVPDC
jgi:hypothetical protein